MLSKVRSRSHEPVYFVDFLGHQYLYDIHHVLHWDVSVNSVLLYNDGTSHGILLDLDLAGFTSPIPPNIHGHVPRGTFDFLSIGLLQGESHSPEHDRESFFYVPWYLGIYYTEAQTVAGVFETRHRSTPSLPPCLPILCTFELLGIARNTGSL